MPSQRQENQNRPRHEGANTATSALAKKSGKKSAAHQKHISMHGQRLISPIQKISTSL
jgi:hypothetical protein